MSGFSVGGFGLVALTSALAIAALMVGTAYLGRRADKVSIVDVTWGLTFVAVAWVGLALGPGDLGRRALVAALVTVWGGRLAWHIGRRAHGAPEDPATSRCSPTLLVGTCTGMPFARSSSPRASSRGSSRSRFR